MNSFRAMRADPQHVSSKRKGIFADVKNDVIAMCAEFVGTVLFLLVALGAAQCVSQNIDPGTGDGATSVSSPTADLTLRIISWFYISFAFGISLYVFASVFFRVTGSIFNPSVGLALWLSGVIGTVRFILTAFAQMLGGIVAAAILDALTPGELGVTARLGAGVSRTRGLFIEMFATAGLCIVVLMLAAEKHRLTPQAPQTIGFTLGVVMLWSIGFSSGSVNTARAFGPDVVARSFPSYHWIYWLGPTMGAIISTGLYRVLKYVGYWRVNPGADSTSNKDSALGDLHKDKEVNGSTGAAGSCNAISTYSNADGNYGTYQHNGSGNVQHRYVAGGRGVNHDKDVNVNLTNGNHHGAAAAVSRPSDATFTNEHSGHAHANGEKLGRPINQSDRSPV